MTRWGWITLALFVALLVWLEWSTADDGLRAFEAQDLRLGIEGP